MDEREDEKILLPKLCEAFKVKSNSVMHFWFIESWRIDCDKAVLPEDFDRYWLYKKTSVNGRM